MAQHTVVQLVDDLDGSEAVETIAFGVDGRTYEIDLNAVNTRKLRGALEPFVAAGRVVRRKAGRTLSSVPTGGARPAAKRAPRGEAQEKRAWLAANGWPEIANKRGRFTFEQDVAWESKTPRGEALKGAPEGGGTVAGASPTVEGPDSEEDAAEAAGETGGGKGTADDSPQTSGKRTRVSKLTASQVGAVNGCTDLVIEAGSTWVLLAGAPEEIVAAIEARRAATPALSLGDKQRLAHVVRKVTSGEGVQVVDAA